MATQNDKLDFSQPENALTKIAMQERGRLIPRNDYSSESESYSAQHPDAIADGDNLGRGTGNYLDIYNQSAGTILDINERVDDIKINKYSASKPYYVSDEGSIAEPARRNSGL
jgi:hypothetical protein